MRVADGGRDPDDDASSPEATADEPETAASEPAADREVSGAETRPDDGRSQGAEPSARPAQGVRALLALPAGILEGGITVVATWLFVGMVFLFEIGGDVEAFERGVDAPADSAIATALDAFGSQEVLLGTAKLIGWLFAGAHQVAVEVSMGDTSGSVNVVSGLADAGALAIPYVYFLVPPILLVYGGYQLARAKPRATTRQSFAVGAMIAIGYAIGAGIIGFLSGIDASGGPSAAPNPLLVPLFAGIYAVVFGGMGGLIADALHRS